jgi:hypothetical protein
MILAVTYSLATHLHFSEKIPILVESYPEPIS